MIINNLILFITTIYAINTVQAIEKTIFKAQSVSGERRSSAPYLSGDTFRAVADHIIENKDLSFSPEKILYGAIIFCKTDVLAFFFSSVHPRITSGYVLITHNSDAPVPDRFASFLDDDKLLAWFGLNVENYTHEKLHPLPIGLANKYWKHGDTEIFDLVKAQSLTVSKDILVNMSFSVNFAYPDHIVAERYKLFNQFYEQPFCLTFYPTNLADYLFDHARSKFVLSPRGNGLDCHRTWEAIYMGSIPIVRTSSLDPMFEKLPVLIINDWKEVTYDFLQKKYDEMSAKNYQLEKLYIPYWIERLNSFKREARE